MGNETGKCEQCNSAERQGVPKGYSARGKRVLKLGSSCCDVPELQSMGIPVVVVDDPELKWGLRKICKMIEHVMEPGMGSPLSKGRNSALGIQFFSVTRPILEADLKSESLYFFKRFDVSNMVGIPNN